MARAQRNFFTEMLVVPRRASIESNKEKAQPRPQGHRWDCGPDQDGLLLILMYK